MLKIVEKSKIWFTISLIIILIGIVSLATRGLQYGIDFKGGTVVQMDIAKDFNKDDVDQIVKKYSKDFQSNKVNNTSIEIKSGDLTNDSISAMTKEIQSKYKGSSVTNQQSIGASIGAETSTKAIEAIIIANIIILLYIGVRFEFKFGFAAVVALIHDVLIMLTVYSVFKIPVDSSFIAAMLTVIGYSMSDTIVVFDRIRENQKYMRRVDVTTLADASITQTFARSINTVLTVLITLTAVFIFVPSIRNFSQPLLIGIISGCYSSIFIASPIWVMFKKMSINKNRRVPNPAK
jgi:preprotein translocase subunit SecF